MKRILSVVLALALTLSFAALVGCDKKEAPAATPTQAPATAAPAAPTPAPPESTAPPAEKDMQARLDAGEHPLVAMCVQGLQDSFIKMQHDFLKEQFEALGFEFSSASSERNVSTMIEQIENYTTMGAEMIIVMPPDNESVMTCVLNAIDHEVFVLYMGLPENDIYQISGGSAVKWSDVGALTTEMVMFWIDQRYPDAKNSKVHTAFALLSDVSFFKTMMDDMMAAFNASATATVAFTKDGVRGIDPGFTWAEEAMTADPDVRIFVAWQDPAAMGGSNYIMSRPDLDKSEFAAFATGISKETPAMVEGSKTDGSVYRGSTAYGSTDTNSNPAQGILNMALDLLFGRAEPPHWNYDTIWTVDAIGFNGVIG